MPSYHIPLIPGMKYHVFSRAVGSEKIFREEKNYYFFLQKYKHHISPIADTYAFCLLPNHFDFFIKIKSLDAIRSWFTKLKKKKKFEAAHAPDFIMERFSNFLNSYSKAYNKVYDRKGGLFMDYLRRVEVNTDEQFVDTVFDIHNHPVHHNYTKSIADWYWSSYKILSGNGPTDLLRKEVLEFFGGNDQFIRYHQHLMLLRPIRF